MAFSFFKNKIGKIKSVKNLNINVFQSSSTQNNCYLQYDEKIITAKKKNLPIVALESTIITHGMPYPDNLNTALEVEDTVRQMGVVPATIAVLDGKIKVGLSKKEIEILAKNEKKEFIKISRRDLAYTILKNLSGGTTVSATMLIAKKAGIPILATGGIGGVHRSSKTTMDISTDLTELSQTAVAVVCSGVKAILDIPKTLEFLETQGVPVVTISSNDKFPAFYCRQTFDGLNSPRTVSNSKEASDLLSAHSQLSLDTGILFAVPIPETFALDPFEIEEIINKAIDTAKVNNIKGSDVTPFLLAEVSRLTAGRCLDSNMALIKNNARVAAEIALNLRDRQNNVSIDNNLDNTKPNVNVVVIGGATFDTVLKIKEPKIRLNGSTHRGESSHTCGGVGRNLASALLNLGISSVKFLSVVGTDEAGKAVLQSLGNAASTVEILPSISTPRYTAIVDKEGNCCFGISEMDAFTKIDNVVLEKNINILKNVDLLIMDGNLPLSAMKLVLDLCTKHKIKVWYEPTDLHKATKIFECSTQWKDVLHFVSPNVNELVAMAQYFRIDVPNIEHFQLNVDIIKNISEQLVHHVPVIIATLGDQGVLVTRKCRDDESFLDSCNSLIQREDVRSRLYAPLSDIGEIKSVSGCGDCLAAGIVSGIVRGWKESACVSLGLHAAKQSLLSFETVPSSLQTLPSAQHYYNVLVQN